MSTRLSLHDHLRDAQVDAARFHGVGPVRAWRPAGRRRALLAGGALAVAVAAAVALAWQGAGDAPAATVVMLDTAPHDEVPTARPLPSPALQAMPPAAAAAPAVMAPAFTPPSEVTPATPAQVPPEDMEAWALHPPLAPEPAVQPAPRPLFNTPVLPDDPAAAPADEGAAEDDNGGGNGE